MSANEPKDLDRRVVRTRNSLLHALIGLIGNTPWDEISVRTICDEADVARSTFYVHFNNKHELLDFGFGTLEGQLSETSPERGLSLNGKFSFLPGLLNHIESHVGVFENLSTSSNGSFVFNRFKTLIAKFAHKELANTPLEHEMSADDLAFVVGGVFAVLEKWNREGCKTPISQLLKEIDRLVARSLICDELKS